MAYILNSGCDCYATVDSELVIYNTCDNRTLMLDGPLSLLFQIIRDIDVGCDLSETKLVTLLHKNNVEFDDDSLNIWMGKLIDLRLISKTEK